jgi:hypothetical protein
MIHKRLALVPGTPSLLLAHAVAGFEAHSRHGDDLPVREVVPGLEA